MLFIATIIEQDVQLLSKINHFGTKITWISEYKAHQQTR